MYLYMCFSLFSLDDSLSTLRALTHVVALHHSRYFYLFMHESECRQFIVAEENRIGLVIVMGRLYLVGRPLPFGEIAAGNVLLAIY